MDFSKLPKLSQNSTPHVMGSPPSSAGSPVHLRRDAIDYAGPGTPVAEAVGLFDIFVACGLGLLFLVLGMDYGRHVFGKTSPFPPVDGTGIVWQEGTPKAGQDVAPDELVEPHKSNYAAQVLGRRMGIISTSSLFLLGGALLAAGLIAIVGHIAALPVGLRRAAASLGVLVTTAGVLYATWATTVLFANGVTPAMTMVGVLAAGLSLFVQVGAARSLFGPVIRAPYEEAGLATAATSLVSAERRVHQRFIHDLLRKRAFADPARTVGTLQGPGAAVLLKELWQQACHAGGVPPTDLPAGVESEMTQVGPYSAVVLSMPTPQQAGEAFYTGIVLRSYKREDGAVIERSPLVLYYCLEATSPSSLDASGLPPAAVLCEWQAGDHVKFTDPVPVACGAFREAMWVTVQARQQAEDAAGSF